MKYAILIFLATGLVFISCKEERSKELLYGVTLTEIPSPCEEGGESNLFVSEAGQVYLSWVEYLNDTTDALVFSKLENEEWSTPQTIAEGSDWFVNWADFPSLVAYNDAGETLAAHWLQTSSSGTYDYDVHISQSTDGGQNWNKSFIPHRDSIAAEHGFVSMLPVSDQKIFATWLDGRNTKGEEHGSSGHDHGHGSGGAMTLRTAVFDRDGRISEEAELDNRICDCCQTAAAQTSDGIIVAYRDRSEDEIRNISIVRKVNGKWTSPKSVSNDNWMIAGCPVNGPSLAANGNKVALAWFTMKNEKPIVKVAFSKDGGENFGKPIQVDDGNPLGRVDVVMISEREALVSWLETKGKGAAIRVVQVNEAGLVGEKITIVESEASRNSGFPRMVNNGNQVIFAWTDASGKTKVKTGVLSLN